VLEAAAQDLRRLRRIVAVLAKYGYTELIGKTPHLRSVAADADGAEVEPEPVPAEATTGPRRFRLLLEELGPTFIKLGQVLSARPDLVSRPYIEELKQLQYQCEPLAFDQIELALAEGLGVDPSTLFEHVDPTPIATASIAQVHRARTRDGREVVVKVQRPGIRAQMRADIDILYRIARILDSVIEESAITESAGVVREFDDALTAELNFTIEAANSREFARLHAPRSDIVVPGVHDELSSDTVLTLDFLSGTPFTDLPADADKRAIAERTVREAFDEVFLDGFFHGDPHPGNLLLLDDGRYGILDFGLCGRLTPQMRETLIVLALAVAIRDADTAARTLYRLGQGDARVSIGELRDDIAGLFDKWLGKTIVEVDSTLLIQELLLLALRHRIRIPAEYSLLARAGATIEGIVREFGPDLDVAAVAAPYAEKLLLDRVAPEQMQGGLYKALLQLQGLSQDVPIQLSQIMADLSAGKFAVRVGGEAFDRLTQSILTAAAVLSGSILGGALVIGSFIALAQVDWRVFGVPLVALLGAVSGLSVFGSVGIYVVLRPRLRKLRLSALLGRRPRPRG
jgi:ubiquinone biosynthesis protein